MTEMTNFFVFYLPEQDQVIHPAVENSKTLNGMFTMMIGISSYMFTLTVFFLYTFQLELHFYILFSLPYRKMPGGI